MFLTTYTPLCSLSSPGFGVNLGSSSCVVGCRDLLVSRPSSMSALIIALEQCGPLWNS